VSASETEQLSTRRQVRKQKEKREEQREGTTLAMGFPGKDSGKCTLVFFRTDVWNECQV
jgi:hypothetical protein